MTENRCVQQGCVEEAKEKYILSTEVRNWNNFFFVKLPAIIIMRIVKTRSLSVSAATLPKPTCGFFIFATESDRDRESEKINEICH